MSPTEIAAARQMLTDIGLVHTYDVESFATYGIWVSEDVRLNAVIVPGDERVVVSWTTRNGIEVADRVSVNLDKNAHALLYALAGATVRA